MQTRASVRATVLAAVLTLFLSLAAAAQVATLQTPGPDTGATPPPDERLEGEEAILAFVACLRDNGQDIPDPQFGAEGVRFVDPTVLARIDFRSADFLDALEACQSYLEAMRPEVDPEQQAEQIEQQLVFAECMRSEGVDFPDPDPSRGYTIASLRGPDGELAIDFFSPAVVAATGVCSAQSGLQGPPGMDDEVAR